MGLGRAISAFQEWELVSGRITDGEGGSPWWAAVNGHLVADLLEATQALEHEEASASGLAAGAETAETAGAAPAAQAVAAWVRYARAEGPGTQAALWEAHQLSIEAGVALATDLLATEPAPEQAFAALALAVVERAAHDGVPTGDPFLGDITSRLYPASYPVDDAGVEALHRSLARLAAGEDPGAAVDSRNERWRRAEPRSRQRRTAQSGSR